jgi:hypothetical protein
VLITLDTGDGGTTPLPTEVAFGDAIEVVEEAEVVPEPACGFPLDEQAAPKASAKTMKATANERIRRCYPGNAHRAPRPRSDGEKHGSRSPSSEMRLCKS